MDPQGGAFRFPVAIKNVGVIGAGISGVASAAHLLRQRLNVTVFERSSVAGGVWHYDPKAPAEPPYPNIRPAAAPDSNHPNDRSPNGSVSQQECRKFDEVALAHAPPSPCYNGLRNNIPTPVMRTTLMDWPAGTSDYVDHGQVEKYIQYLAVRTGAQGHIQYDTRVESVRKNATARDTSWTIRTRTLRRVGDEGHEIVDREWAFDAVVVASGRYHEPKIPDVPGLKEWKQRFPDNVIHSKRYRTPEPFEGKTVFLVGSGVSALDIAREIDGIARETYQSARDGQFDLPAGMFAPGVRRVGPVDKFVLEEGSARGNVVLKDGQVIQGIDVIILCTGYITSYPFLGHLQAPALPKEEADEKVIITSDGCTTHNLHKDIFYIPDPTLAFVGVPYHASAFSLFDFQAEVVARVFGGKAQLASQQAMRSDYDERRVGIAAGGAAFHSLMRKDVEYMKVIQEWINRDAVRLGHELMDAIDERWVKSYFSFVEEMKGRRWSGLEEEQQLQFVGEALRHSRDSAVSA